MKKIIVFFVITLLSVMTSWGGDIKFGGPVQTWLSYGEDKSLGGPDDGPCGFGSKRLEFNPSGAISDKINWGFMVVRFRDNYVIKDETMVSNFVLPKNNIGYINIQYTF